MWTVRELISQAEHVSHRLQAHGVGPGAIVAWWGPPSLDFAAVLLGAWHAGATYVGIHPRYTAREVRAVLQHAAPTVVVYADTLTPTPDAIALDEQGHPPVLVSMRALREAGDRSSAHEGRAAQGSVLTTAPASVAPALLVFTTGSTGTPKAAVLSHEGIAEAARAQVNAMTCRVAHVISALPVNHVGGLINITLAAWWGEESVVFVPVFSVASLTAAVATLASVRLPAVPTLLQRCLDDAVDAPAFAAVARGRVRHVLSGGAPLPISVVDGFSALGATVQGMYGLTEVSGSVCFTEAGDSRELMSLTIGRAHATVQLRVAPAGDEVGGELQVRGRQAFAGYLGDAHATAEAFTDDGWLRTGDLARLRADGRVEITGRLKDVVNVRGYKIMPREIETVLLAHPDVQAAAVVGVPAARTGEALVAFVVGVPHTGVSDAGGSTLVDAWCRAHLAPHKVPQHVVVVEALPLVGVGKVDRPALRTLARERFASEVPAFDRPPSSGVGDA